jgi:hypothetical protein
MAAFITLCLICLPLFSHAQSVSTMMGARVAGMGFASATVPNEFSVFNNFGTLAKLETISVGFAYEVNGLMPGANRMAASFNLPMSFGVASIGAFRFGDDLYSEQILSTSFGNKFGIASLGARANCIQYQAETYGTKSAVSFDFGGLVQLTEQISAGAYIINLTQSRITDDEYLPVKLVAGVGFKPTSQVLISTEIEKDIDFKPLFRAGIEYAIHKKVFVRTGLNLNPSKGFFGLGFISGHLKIDYALQLAFDLGITNQASAICLLSSSRKK